MIIAISYETDKQTLRIEFRNGTVYDYFIVPEGIYKEMVNSHSKGGYFLKVIKTTYPSLQVS